MIALIPCFHSGEAVEEWQFQPTCPFGLFITTPGHSALLFNASLDTVSSWNGGITHQPRSGMTAVGSQLLYSGVWEGSVRFQRQSCSISIELDAFPDSDPLMPHIHLHALACAPPRARRAAPTQPRVEPASRRLLQTNESNDGAASEDAPPAVGGGGRLQTNATNPSDAASEEAPPAVAVADLRRGGAATAFFLRAALNNSNLTSSLNVATRLALALPTAAGARLLHVPPLPCAALGEAPRARAISPGAARPWDAAPVAPPLVCRPGTLG